MSEPSPARRLVGDAIRLLEDDPAPAARLLRRAANLIDPGRVQEQAGGELEQAHAERETAIGWAVRLEGEVAHLEASRAEFVEDLRGATDRVFEERRKILPLRIERDELADGCRGLRHRLTSAERRAIDLEETLEERDREISVLLDRLGIDEVEYLRADVVDRVNRAVDRIAERTRAHQESAP